MANKYFTFTKNEFLESVQQELSPQDYYNSYLYFFWFCTVLTFVCQGLSLGSESMYFYQIFSSSISGTLLIIATVLFCLLIELSKFFVFGAFFKQLFLLDKASINPYLLALALSISGVSIYASIVGGGSFGIDTAKVITTESKHDKEIQALRSEIADIKHRNTWKGNTYIAGKDKALLHAKERELIKVKELKERELQAVQAQNQAQETVYRYWFASFELVFILATLFVYYFKRRSYVECRESISTDKLTAKVGFSTVPNSTIAPNGQTARIGFQLGQSLEGISLEGNKEVIIQLQPNERICKHCNKRFTFKHWNATYCSRDCKNKSWELRTGKKLILNKKGGVK